MTDGARLSSKLLEGAERRRLTSKLAGYLPGPERVSDANTRTVFSSAPRLMYYISAYISGERLCETSGVLGRKTAPKPRTE
jgi:hypothetical protein